MCAATAGGFAFTKTGPPPPSLPASTQVQHRDMIMELEHPTAGQIKLPGMPVKYSSPAAPQPPPPPHVPTPPPLLGQHTREILAGMGYSDGRIVKLEDDSVVQTTAP